MSQTSGEPPEPTALQELLVAVASPSRDAAAVDVALRALCRVMVHDFNNILSIINTYAGILRMDIPSSVASARHVEQIALAVQRGQRLTEQVQSCFPAPAPVRAPPGVAEAAAEPPSAATAEPKVSPAGGALAAPVLLVDDEPWVLRSLQETLRRCGIASHACGSAVEALTWLESNTARALLTDQRMPGCTGLELARMVKLRWAELPVIMLTGSSDVSAHAAREAGVVRMVSKPIEVTNLLEILRQVARRPTD